MTEPAIRPLITFFVVAFNQERFVREAVLSALNQTYSPLQIILSDDCSKDRSFDIMQQLGAEYRGPHQVQLNRNPWNLCIGGHVNRIMELAHGELVVGMAGDDISLPDRTERLFEAWENSGRKSLSLYSAMKRMDAEGKVLGEFPYAALPNRDLGYLIRRFTPDATGASHAWHRKLFDVFGPLPGQLLFEDRAIPFRAHLLGQPPIYVPEPLVLYREHGGNVDNQAMRQIKNQPGGEAALCRRTWAHRSIVLVSYAQDLRKARDAGVISEECFFRCLRQVAVAFVLTAVGGGFHLGSSRGASWRRLVGEFFKFQGALLRDLGKFVRRPDW